MVKLETNNSVRLCCGGKGCPVIKDLGNGMVEITDDHGNTVIMKKEEALLIKDGIQVLDSRQLILE